MYICFLPLTKKVNSVYFHSKLIRKLYFKKNKKADDPLQNMIGASKKKRRKETDPMFMKSVIFKFSDYIGPFIISIKNLFNRRKLA